MENKVNKGFNKYLILCLFLCSCTPHYSVIDTQLYKSLEGSTKQTSDDSLFVKKEIDKYESLGKASEYHSNQGWSYLRSTEIGWSIPFYRALNNPGKLKSALTFFDNAWLIDSTKADPYWGMAIIASVHEEKYKSSIELMSEAVSRDSTNLRLRFDYGISNYNVINKSNDLDSLTTMKYRNNAIEAFEIVRDSADDARMLQLAEAYLILLKEKGNEKE